MSLAETLAWLQGVCHNIIEQRANCAYRWGQLGHVLASTLSSFETAAQICLAYLPSVPRRTLSARTPAGSSCRCLAPGPLPLVCPENPSDDEQSSCDEDESSSFGDTHSLPDFLLSDIEENYEYGLPNATADTTMSEGDTEPNLPIVSASVLVEHMLEQSLKHAAYTLTKHVFLKPPRSHGLPHHRRFSTYYGATSRKHRSSVGCLPAQLSVALHPRPSSGFFRTTTPLLLPAPVFLPEALEIGLFCEKGTRAHNEDMAFTMKLDSSVHSCFQQAVCMGVFDGHGGVDVAAHLTECLPELVAKRCKHIKEQGVQEVATIMLGLEDDLCARYHREWQPAGRDPGSTALVATIMDDLLLIANVGDCRLLLISEAADNLGNRTAFVAKATCDHHCARNKDEAQRIRTAGAHVDAAGYIGSLLEVSRSLGDFQTKGELGKDVIISEPEVYTWKLGPQDLMAVAVTDGISGSMDDMEICNMVCKLLNDKKHLNDPAFAARELANFAAFAKGSSDNCSAVVVVLKDQPPPEPARRRLFGRK